ncbi:hypothetical protein BJV77DRAFT_1111234, partial [Russula vinacea]
MLWVRKVEPWSPKLPSSGEGMRWSPRTSTARGQRNSHVWACTQNTQLLLVVSETVSILASLIYLVHTFHPTTHQSYTSQMYIIPQSTASSQQGVTLALSHAQSWRPNWALSRRRPCPSFPKLPNLANTRRYIIFPSPISPRQRQHPSIPISTARISRVLGEPSLPLCRSLHTYPRAHRHRYAMWQRHTELSQPTHHNGRAWSYAYRTKTNMRSMCATTLALPQREGCTEWWQMQARTFSGAMGLAHWQNGLMTTYSSESHVNTCSPTTSPAPNGVMKSDSKEAANRRVAVYGTRERTAQTAPQRSLTRTAISHSGTWQQPPPAVRRTRSFHMQMQTLTPFQNTWEFTGKLPNPSHSDQKSPTWVSCGTYKHAQSASLKRKGSNTWLQSQIGRRNQRTSCRKHKSCTGNYSTHPWSYTQDVLTSPTWRPCSPQVIIALSYHAPHPEIQQATWNGGGNDSANQTAPDPSQNPNHSSTLELTPMRAQGSESRSQLAQNGGPGVWPQDGNPRAEISCGPKPPVLSFSSSAYYQLPTRVTTSQYMVTTGASSRDGGTNPATTNPPTGSSGASWSYQRAATEQYTRGMFRAPRTLLTLPHGDDTPHMNSSSRSSTSRVNYAPSSLASSLVELNRKAALKRLLPATNPARDNPSGQQAPKRIKPLEARPRQLDVPKTTPLQPKPPAPYQQGLTPALSCLRPHCLARDRLRQWIPMPSQAAESDITNLSRAERERVKDTMVHAWEEDTREAYGSGLLMWHCFC